MNACVCVILDRRLMCLITSDHNRSCSDQRFHITLFLTSCLLPLLFVQVVAFKAATGHDHPHTPLQGGSADREQLRQWQLQQSAQRLQHNTQGEQQIPHQESAQQELQHTLQAQWQQQESTQQQQHCHQEQGSAKRMRVESPKAAAAAAAQALATALVAEPPAHTATAVDASDTKGAAGSGCQAATAADAAVVPAQGGGNKGVRPKGQLTLKDLWRQ